MKGPLGANVGTFEMTGLVGKHLHAA